MGLASGTVFAGRYEIVGLLGKGGMGSVYRAVHKELRREVALKILDAPLVVNGQADDGAVRFEREARAIAKLDHPSIVRILDYGRTLRNQFIAMQLLEGPTLGQQLRKTPKLAPSRALQITRHLLTALGHAHDCGILHRDLKPDNVMLVGLPRAKGSRPPLPAPRPNDLGLAHSQTMLGLGLRALGSGPHPIDTNDAHPAARAVLIDFGLAYVFDEAALTARGACVGSPSYLAPERLDGKGPDVRSDLYAVGVMLYEMLAGARPFSGDSVGEILLACRTQPARPLRAVRSELSRPLEAFVVKALTKDPAQRFQTAEEMLEALEDISVLEQLEHEAVRDDAEETSIEIPLTLPTRWSRLWTWMRFGRWRWRDDHLIER